MHMQTKLTSGAAAVVLGGLVAGALAAPVSAATLTTYSNDQTAQTGVATAQAPAPSYRGWSVEQMAQQRLTELHNTLRITGREQPAWNQFAETALGNARTLDQLYRQRAESLPTMNAVENLRSFGQIQSQQAANIQRALPAFENLYSQLSPAQRQTADQMFRNWMYRYGARVSQR
jgi:LTXXQ motif family protein